MLFGVTIGDRIGEQVLRMPFASASAISSKLPVRSWNLWPCVQGRAFPGVEESAPATKPPAIVQPGRRAM